MKKSPPPFRLGKKPPRIDARTLQLANYLPRQGTEAQRARALAPAPPSIDWTAKISSWPMMANDTLGDCTCAAAGHMIECWTANLGDAFTPTNAQVIAAYSATGHYIVGDPATDNGAVELDVLNYWRQQGIAGHKIDAYASLDLHNDPHNQDCAKQAISLFGGVYIAMSSALICVQKRERLNGQLKKSRIPQPRIPAQSTRVKVVLANPPRFSHAAPADSSLPPYSGSDPMRHRNAACLRDLRLPALARGTGIRPPAACPPKSIRRPPKSS
jgi:hypothetical protein